MKLRRWAYSAGDINTHEAGNMRKRLYRRSVKVCDVEAKRLYVRGWRCQVVRSPALEYGSRHLRQVGGAVLVKR